MSYATEHRIVHKPEGIAFLDKACEWLERAIEQWNNAERHRTFYIDKEGSVRKFRNAMKVE